MIHRHLTHERFTAAALDDLVARGCREDWRSLREALKTDADLMDKLERVCLAHAADPYAQRYHFWVQYVRRSVRAA